MTRADSDTAEAPIVLVPYDPDWPGLFEQERQQLAVLLGPWLAGEIEHVGSTAVPSLDAKPVIDIMAPVETLHASRPAIGALAKLGYCHSDYMPDVMHWFCKPSFRLRTHHLSLIPAGSALWNARIAFRDALRASPALASEYAALKRGLAEKFRHDREAYTEAKSPFVERVLSELGSGDTRKT